MKRKTIVQVLVYNTTSKPFSSKFRSVWSGSLYDGVAGGFGGCFGGASGLRCSGAGRGSVEISIKSDIKWNFFSGKMKRRLLLTTKCQCICTELDYICVFYNLCSFTEFYRVLLLFGSAKKTRKQKHFIYLILVLLGCLHVHVVCYSKRSMMAGQGQRWSLTYFTTVEETQNARSKSSSAKCSLKTSNFSVKSNAKPPWRICNISSQRSFFTKFERPGRAMYLVVLTTNSVAFPGKGKEKGHGREWGCEKESVYRGGVEVEGGKRCYFQVFRLQAKRFNLLPLYTRPIHPSRQAKQRCLTKAGLSTFLYHECANVVKTSNCVSLYFLTFNFSAHFSDVPPKLPKCVPRFMRAL